MRLDSISLDNVELWDTENPNLYTMVATLYRPDGSVADRLEERFGIRSLEFSPNSDSSSTERRYSLKELPTITPSERLEPQPIQRRWRSA